MKRKLGVINDENDSRDSDVAWLDLGKEHYQ